GLSTLFFIFVYNPSMLEAGALEQRASRQDRHASRRFGCALPRGRNVVQDLWIRQSDSRWVCMVLPNNWLHTTWLPALVTSIAAEKVSCGQLAEPAITLPFRFIEELVQRCRLGKVGMLCTIIYQISRTLAGELRLNHEYRAVVFIFIDDL